MNIACYRYRLTPEEVLTAATLNAAAAIGKAEQVGTLEPGKQADLLIWDADNLNFIFYLSLIHIFLLLAVFRRRKLP